MKRVLRYFEKFDKVFVDQSSETGISFDLSRREAFKSWLENLVYASDFKAESNERVLIEMRSDIEVYLSNHIVSFVDMFEKKRLDSLKTVSKETIRKASVTQGIAVPETRGHRKRLSSGSSGGLFGTLMRKVSPRPPDGK